MKFSQDPIKITESVRKRKKKKKFIRKFSRRFNFFGNDSFVHEIKENQKSLLRDMKENGHITKENQQNRDKNPMIVLQFYETLGNIWNFFLYSLI